MACFHPLEATLYTLDDGKRTVKLGHMLGRLFGIYEGEEINLPCGKCIGCLNARAADWSVRNYHELFVSKKSSFLTLTYKPKYLPQNGSLVKQDVQKFIKRLRWRLWNEFKVRIRYFAVGEYGAKKARPHYHVLIFGWDFPDRKFFKLNKHSQYLYVSRLLSETWKFGHSSVGDVSMNSIKYVSKYVTKRVYGKDGTYGLKVPEFNLCSRNPVIGGEFLRKYVDDIYNSDRVVIDSRHKYRVPRAYDKWLEKNDFERFQRVKLLRKERVVKYSLHELMDRESYAIGIFNTKNLRGYEGDHVWSGPRYYPDRYFEDEVNEAQRVQLKSSYTELMEDARSNLVIEYGRPREFNIFAS